MLPHLCDEMSCLRYDSEVPQHSGHVMNICMTESEFVKLVAGNQSKKVLYKGFFHGEMYILQLKINNFSFFLHVFVGY